MYEFVDNLLQKRRFVIALAAILIDLLLMTTLTPTVRSHHAVLESRIHATYSFQQPQSPNAVTDALGSLAGDAGQASNALEIDMIRGVLSFASGLESFNRTLGHSAYTTVAVTVNSSKGTVLFLVHSNLMVLGFAGRTASNAGIAGTRAVSDDLSVNGHGIGNMMGLVGGITHIASVIRPTDATPAPTITQLRAQQSALIQSGTVDVSVAAMTSGSGGACDAGGGNGGYPMAWCNAAMDTVSTIGYSGDSINRECTSYAFWYFTVIEGHADFKVWGNAKDWAQSSNYPTHDLPEVGALAVETAGAYGHVAIVQALPGQKYAGQVVPDGYVLVSEMNYDWNGHFRYSYSPLTKFSAYIYP